MYSPTDARVTGVLSNGHTQGVRDFKFKYGVLNPEGWSIGGDGKLVQWDLQKTKSIRYVKTIAQFRIGEPLPPPRVMQSTRNMIYKKFLR